MTSRLQLLAGLLLLIGSVTMGIQLTCAHAAPAPVEVPGDASLTNGVYLDPSFNGGTFYAVARVTTNVAYQLQYAYQATGPWLAFTPATTFTYSTTWELAIAPTGDCRFWRVMSKPI